MGWSTDGWWLQCSEDILVGQCIDPCTAIHGTCGVPVKSEHPGLTMPCPVMSIMFMVSWLINDWLTVQLCMLYAWLSFYVLQCRQKSYLCSFLLFSPCHMTNYSSPAQLGYVALNYWWDLKRNPAGCMPKDLKCPISDPAVFLTWCWPNIINLPLTFPFAMWHER